MIRSWCRTHARWLIIVLFGLAMMASCSGPAPSGEGGWLAGNVDQKFDTVARQLQGFDTAMVENGYRCTELYWAAQDGNWGYADYQVKKIRTAVENGLQRRPKRAASAETFLTPVLPAVEDAIARRDAALLKQRMATLRSTCNSRHEAEKVESVRVGIPQVRPFTANPH